jgi:ribosomal protein S13
MKVYDEYNDNNIVVMGIGKSNEYAKIIHDDDFANQYIDTDLHEETSQHIEEEINKTYDIFEKKVDYSKIRVKQLIECIKKYKKQDDIQINTTGLTKKQLVHIVDKLLIN